MHNLISDLRSQKLSVYDIAKKLDCYPSSVYYHLKKEPRQESQFTSGQINILNGLMLGDGCLYPHNRGVIFSCGSKHKSYLMRLKRILPLRWGRIRLSKGCYILTSHVQRSLNLWEQKWYVRGSFSESYPWQRFKGTQQRRRIIPRDLILDPLSAYHWFVGDGTSTKYSISLATMRFVDEDIEFLQSLLDQKGIKADIYKNRSLNITSRDNVQTFYDYIGMCKDFEFKYKWKQKLVLSINA